MPATVVDPRTQIRDALTFVRDARHHSGCRCCQFRDHDGSGYCSDREATWNRAVNQLIQRVLDA